MSERKMLNQPRGLGPLRPNVNPIGPLRPQVDPTPASFAEPSEPSEIRPEDRPADTLRGAQEENPQLVAHVGGRQAGDAKGANDGQQRSRSGGRALGEGEPAEAEAERVDEEKREDVAGGFGVGRRGAAKL